MTGQPNSICTANFPTTGNFPGRNNRRDRGVIKPRTRSISPRFRARCSQSRAVARLGNEELRIRFGLFALFARWTRRIFFGFFFPWFTSNQHSESEQERVSPRGCSSAPRVRREMGPRPRLLPCAIARVQCTTFGRLSGPVSLDHRSWQGEYPRLGCRRARCVFEHWTRAVEVDSIRATAQDPPSVASRRVASFVRSCLRLVACHPRLSRTPR